MLRYVASFVVAAYVHASGDRFKPVPLRLACGAFYEAVEYGQFPDIFRIH